MKPFLLLSVRPEPAAAKGEHLAIAKFAGVMPSQLVQHHVIDAPLGGLDLGAYSGVILGGGPFNSSDEDKSEAQVRVEADLAYVVDEVLSRGIGFLGLCYGVGVLTSSRGGIVDRSYGEPPSGVVVRLTDEGRLDPLLEGVDEEFVAFVAHKEACFQLPPGATLLAEGDGCPVQMFRIGEHAYATQFHPELDADALADRLRIYQNAGYFDPDSLSDLIQMAYSTPMTPAVHKVLSNFVARYAQG